ncbi:MAG: hypothetical protein CL891_05385 [Dehalococcoidia bacterium]|nr:hypothetical protein [Dehalococcoidia bacterium]
MSLDLNKAIKKIEEITYLHRKEFEDREARIRLSVKHMGESTGEEIAGKLRSVSNRPFLWAGATEGLGQVYEPGPLPKAFSVASTDGSHIDVDRHMPIPCALINIGGCVIRYNLQTKSEFFNEPEVYHGEGLYLKGDTNTVDEVYIEGSTLGMLRTVGEIEYLSNILTEYQDNSPILGLMDGSLILWQVSGPGVPQLVKRRVIDQTFIPAMDKLKNLSKTRALGIASYISMPRSTDVVNTLRLYLCQSADEKCSGLCSIRKSLSSPCNLVNNIVDRDIFAALLKEGQRSAIFSSTSVIMEDYGNHRICFFYVNNGWEIGRVEVPQWIACNPDLLSLTHTLVLDQCRKGIGYPVAVSEAHEQAVLTGSDRRAFQDMILAQINNGVSSNNTSQKDRSKRLPWL